MITAYAAWNKDDEIRRISSSGGVFFAIAKYVIERNGVVFGAKFDENWNVIHGEAGTLEEVKAFLGSKYTQSSMGDIFKRVKQELNDGKLCLFSGTACQIGGLKAYLGKEYENLVAVDFICHGVPSRRMWREYVQQHNPDEITKISFRDKTEGWLDFSLKMDYRNGESYRNNQHNDLFMNGFLQDIYLRPSCYECAFRGMERNSDITLADYWGVQKDLPEMFDNKGTSALFINSEMGKTIWKVISSSFQYIEVDPNRPIAFNPAMIRSPKKPDKRDKYLKAEDKWKAIRKLTTVTLKDRIIRKAKRVIKKLIGRK